jgi:hypothetical protein
MSKEQLPDDPDRCGIHLISTVLAYKHLRISAYPNYFCTLIEKVGDVPMLDVFRGLEAALGPLDEALRKSLIGTRWRCTSGWPRARVDHLRNALD